MSDKQIAGNMASYMADMVKTAALLQEATNDLQWELCYGNTTNAVSQVSSIKAYLRQLKHAADMFEHCDQFNEKGEPLKVVK